MPDVARHPVRARRIGVAALSLLFGSAVAAFVLWLQVPSPPGEPNVLSFVSWLAFLSLVGPVFYAWAAGPASLSGLELFAAFFVPLIAVVTMFYGYVLRSSLVALVCAAAIWGLFGGYAAYLAVMGTI